MISAVSARFVFATKTACSSALRKKGAGRRRHFGLSPLVWTGQKRPMARRRDRNSLSQTTDRKLVELAVRGLPNCYRIVLYGVDKYFRDQCEPFGVDLRSQ
jgi:hypothetical protein